MFSNDSINENLLPLAERVRPQSLNDFIGQEHLVHEKSLLVKSISINKPFSIILWGPPGSGKTSLARILSNEFDIDFFELSATSSGLKQIREILDQGKQLFSNGKRSILFIDEIHRFNKSQQDALLSSVEKGSIILVGATTENPAFEVISPLLSRCRLLKLNPLKNSDLDTIINHALNKDLIYSKYKISIDCDARALLTHASGGDTRKMLNTLELAISLKSDKKQHLHIKYIKEALQEKYVIYDKLGDYHYDVISAFIKSIRGSDPDAAIYWLAVMINGGEKPEFIARRLIILASEDIGNAEPYALQLATSALEAVNKIGMPESRIILAQITIYLSAAPKSNASYNAIDNAIKEVKENGAGLVPLHLRSKVSNINPNSTFYKYVHSYQNNFINQNYFPDSFKKKPKFYKPHNQGREISIKARLLELWKDRYK
jgi:putative ATPase